MEPGQQRKADVRGVGGVSVLDDVLHCQVRILHREGGSRPRRSRCEGVLVGSSSYHTDTGTAVLGVRTIRRHSRVSGASLSRAVGDVPVVPAVLLHVVVARVADAVRVRPAGVTGSRMCVSRQLCDREDLGRGPSGRRERVGRVDSNG